MTASRRDVSKVLAALGCEVRLKIAAELLGGPKTAGAVTAAVGLSQPATSHHLTSLRHAGLVDFDRAGKFNTYRLTALAAAILPAVEKVVAKHGGK
jgi:DNA-binding transcriptional ArsR family regulator